jgi:hypothetical protein
MTETAVQQRPPSLEPSRFSEAEIERALVELVAQSGNTRKTALLLKEDGLQVDQKTLWRWKTGKFADRYAHLREKLGPQITAQAAEQHMALAQYQTEIAAEAATRVRTRLPKMDDRDLINAMGKADIGSGIHTEKAQLLSGQPTHRADRSVEELLRGLASKGVQLGEKREEADGSVVERVAVLPATEEQNG